MKIIDILGLKIENIFDVDLNGKMSFSVDWRMLMVSGLFFVCVV